ncbi:WD-40 repeat-containing protein [Reticulomyxa filosa]|uniref:WD-40 repeat-containing protein n=1 Tax=Reticulomyxa filosa TaxID=46433 RepID=X6NTN0_RETFI|nr:WD-40 repeat-containing protein [Reticulomyxa filosa]|eukprot:ETO29645.1 WD-40 repeat-containing protein [Reticulomyxa filosa]
MIFFLIHQTTIYLRLGKIFGSDKVNKTKHFEFYRRLLLMDEKKTTTDDTCSLWMSLIQIPIRWHRLINKESFDGLPDAFSVYLQNCNMHDYILTDNATCNGGMQDNSKHSIIDEENKKYTKEVKTLVRLFGDLINKEELQQKIELYNGNIELVIKDLVQQSIEKEVQNKKQELLFFVLLFNLFIFFFNVLTKKDKLEAERKSNEVKEESNDDNTSKSVEKEIEKTEIGETEPGINLQGYCTNEICLASKAKLPIWINIGFGDIAFISNKTSFSCPDCKKVTVTSVVKAMFYNSEHSICASGDSIPVKDNNYQCLYSIKPGLSYELKANKIRQHAKSIEDLRERSEHAMKSIEIRDLVTELQKYKITVVKPSSLKGNERLLEKIQADYGGDFNQAFDIGRFTILCDDSIKLQTAVAVMKKAEQFNLIVSEDRDFFDKKSKTHHRVHNIKLYVPKHDVYIEMQATLKSFTTLEGYTVIENPKLSHLFYEHIRVWKPNNPSEEELKRASDEILTNINDIICEWIDIKEIKKIANRYKPNSEIRILKPPQLKGINEEEINTKNDISLKLTKFVYDQLCKFNPMKMKGQAIYVINKKARIGRRYNTLQALETYIPLQANNYLYTGVDDNKDNTTYDCYQHILDLLKEKEEKKFEQKEVVILQGKSGSGKSLFCRHLEEALWESYVSDSTTSIPVYISLSKCYNGLNERQIISQALQMKQINKEMIDAIRENMSFVFILDGFDEIFDKYNKNNNERYFYDCFNLSEWNAKIIVSCRSHVLSDEDIKHVLIGSNDIAKTPMIYLWPFSKEQMNGYIDKFVRMNKANKMNQYLDWTAQQYEETLNNYASLHKMMEEPFLLRMILTVLPSLMKQHLVGTKLSKSQVYEAFNELWIDTHVKNISNKLSELRIRTNPKKIKLSFQQYCQDLGFEMFLQGNQVATENDDSMQNSDSKILSKLDSNMEIDEKIELKKDELDTPAVTIQDVWEKYFKADNVAKYVLRRIGNNKYQFLHKSCQEFYAAQKIIFDILSWKPTIADIDNQKLQQQFGVHAHHFLINHKLLNEEMGIIQFIAERIYNINPIYANLKSRLFRIIESSKSHSNVSIAAANAITILNSANVNMHNQNWDSIKIPYAILNHAFLEGTNLSNAHLDNVHFAHACLNKANFTSASMNGIYFGEYAYLKGHSNSVLGVKFSPDGSKILSYSLDKTIRIWDTSSRKQLHLLQNTNLPRAVYFSPDGSKIVSYSESTTIYLWDVLSGQQLQTWEGHSNSITDVQFSSNGSKVVSSSLDGTIRVWDVLSGEHIQLLTEPSTWIGSIHLSPDDSKIVSYLNDKTIRVWDALSGKQLQILQGHSEDINDAQFLSNGSKIVSYSIDETIRIWDVSSGQQIHILRGHSSVINGIHLSPDNSKIVSYSDDDTIQIWDVLSGKQLHVLKGQSGRVKAAQFSPDGSKIVSGSVDTIRIWDVLSGKQIQILEGHSGIVCGVEFFPNESKILSCSDDGTIRMWDLTLQKKVQLIEEYLDIVTGVQFSPDTSKIVSCSGKALQLWDAQSGRQIQVFEGHLSDVRGVLFSLDGSKIISYSSDKTIRIWDILSGRQLHELVGHQDYVIEVQSSSDGFKIASCSKETTVRIWDISSGKEIQLLHGHSSSILGVQFSPDGSKIVSCSYDKTIRLWDVPSGKQLCVFGGHSQYVTRARFSQNGSKIVSSSRDKTVRIWDVSSGKQLLLLKGHTDMVNDVHWVWGFQLSSDVSKVISYSKDKTIRIWDISSGKQIQLFEEHTGDIKNIHILSDGSKFVSCSEDKTIRLWSIDNRKLINMTEPNLMKCIWRRGVQSGGLLMKDSIWKDTNGLTFQQKLLVEQRGGTF